MKKRNPGIYPLEWTITSGVLLSVAMWIAAGSAGLFAYPLRTVTGWILSGIVVVLALPHLRNRYWRLGAIAAWCTGACIPSLINRVPDGGIALCILPVVIMAGLDGRNRRIISSFAITMILFWLYKSLLTAVPLFWLILDGTGNLVGRAAGSVVQQPLRTGITFAGLDFCVYTVIWYLFACGHSSSPKQKRIFGELGILVAVHLLYLVFAALLPLIIKLLPAAKVDETTPSRFAALHTGIMWSFPLLAALFHCVFIYVIAHMKKWDTTPFKPAAGSKNHLISLCAHWRICIPAVVIIAIGFTASTTLFPKKRSLDGKKIVVWKEGYLNWDTPKHGDYGRFSIGMYGMMPDYIHRLGGRCVISPDLSDNDLKDADLCILIYPDDPWKKGQLERLWSYVRRGGTLMVMGEHTTRNSEGGSYINDVLSPTGMRVKFDSGIFGVGGWLQSYEVMSHPSTTGIRDNRNQFGVVIGASLSVKPPARPMLIGRFGWADHGDTTTPSMMGNSAYDSGEKLGDIIVAAQQRLGRGRIIVFGDTSNLSNGLMISCHPFTSRLFACLAEREAQGTPLWREIVCVLLAMIFTAVLLISLHEWVWGAGIIALMVSQAVFVTISFRSSEIFPNNRSGEPRKLAYIDDSHMPLNSAESWRETGIMGLNLTLMRNGYLPLVLEEITEKRLAGADLLIFNTPLKKFCKKDRTLIGNFISGGGHVIITCGWDEREASRKLLTGFGLRVGLPVPLMPGKSKPVVEQVPVPMGHFKAPYLRIKETPDSEEYYMCHVRFHAAWPVSGNSNDDIIAYGIGNLPVIILKKYFSGKIVLIGDARFTANINLELEGGEAFEGMRENADFWRWFLGYLNDNDTWIPPRQIPVLDQPPAETTQAGTGEEEAEGGKSGDHTPEEYDPDNDPELDKEIERIIDSIYAEEKGGGS